MKRRQFIALLGVRRLWLAGCAWWFRGKTWQWRRSSLSLPHEWGLN
jgi:hypothetical protein